MPMSAQELESALREAFPDADIAIEDLAGDGDHYRARVASPAFRGLSRVRQHQMVYAALKGRVGQALHALALETAAPPDRTPCVTALSEIPAPPSPAYPWRSPTIRCGPTSASG
jgi:stress-induced morphogen